MSQLVRRNLPRLRRTLVGCVTAAAMVVAFTGCNTGGEICGLSGTANFTPGLKTGAQAINYTFTGKLTGCSGLVGGIPRLKSATISASGSGNLSCVTGPSKGTALITWNTGETSNISYTTTGALNAVHVAATFTGGTFKGRTAKGELAFTVADPTQCNSTGVSSATFTGQVVPL